MIRHRVYTHHSRIAGSFRKGRLMLAGDAAHLMPVWQGQGYNSGIRDAANLGWKLAAVVSGQAEDALLDTYDVERRKHARAMIDLSTMVGRVISPTNRRVAALRDRVDSRRVGGARAEALHPGDAVQTDAALPAGRRLPRRATRRQPNPRRPAPCSSSPASTPATQQNVLLDDVLGTGFAVLCWSNNPRALLGDEAFARWKALGAKFVAVRPMTQLHWTGHDDPDVVIVGDRTGALKSWFDTHTDSVLFLRPDRCIAGACIAAARTRRERVAVQGSLSDPGRRMVPLALCCMSHSPLLNLPGPSQDLLDDIGVRAGRSPRVRRATTTRSSSSFSLRTTTTGSSTG